LEGDDAKKVSTKFHDGSLGGNFGRDTTIQKILRAGYY